MKVDKYDRQIRLWGSNGQRRLGQATVALVGCTGSGIEALKNLVLPGIGTIHIWDETMIAVEDLSQSFFYEFDSIGKPKAEEACRNLVEMNPDVEGKFFVKGLKDFLDEGVNQQKYDLVLFGDLTT